MAVTLKDIARRVNRSVTTVSRALDDYNDVSPETKTLIRSVADEMGYIPNITARQLQKRRTDTFGLILPSENLRFSDPFFSDLLSGFVSKATEFGFDLLVSSHPSTDDETKDYLQFIRSRKVDGFIVIRTQLDDARIDLLQEHNYPFVAFGRTGGENDFPFIDEDSELGVQKVVDHLVGLGHTRLAFIAEPTYLTKSYLRLKGFQDALEKHGLDFDKDLILEGGFRQRSGRLLGEQLLDRPKPPSAIVACNDLIALGVMGAARELGYTIGQDISVTGFDDIILAEYAHPPLTTIHQPAYQIGRSICQMLVKIINHESLEMKQIILQPELIVRQSTGPAKT